MMGGKALDMKGNIMIKEAEEVMLIVSIQHKHHSQSKNFAYIVKYIKH